MNINVNVESYLNLITSQHRVRPKYIALLTAVFTPLLEITNQISNVDYLFDVDYAVGDQLDMIGSIVGISRKVDFLLSNGTTALDDTDYRSLIKARIAQNAWDGTRESLFDTWKLIFPEETLGFIDNQDMTCIVLADTVEITDDYLALLYDGLLIPRPSGVSYTVVLGQTIFAWDSNSTFFKGWDEGEWTVWDS